MSIPITSPMTAHLTYDVGQLNVRRDGLGTALSVRRADAEVELELPGPDGRFSEDVDGFGTGLSGVRIGPDGAESQLLGVRLVRARVTFEPPTTQEPGDPEWAALLLADKLGVDAVRGLLDWARSFDGQVWLGPGHETPPLRPHVWLINAEGERSDWHGEIRERRVVVLPFEDTADMGSVLSAQTSLSAPALPVAELLLAEARWAVWPQNDPDPQRAVLLAAIALEVKTPESLREAADDPVGGLLEILLRSHDEIPTSVPFQLDKVAQQVFGASLKQQDGALYKQIRRLFELRNDVAHRGQRPEVQETRYSVAAAVAAFEWLDARVAGVGRAGS